MNLNQDRIDTLAENIRNARRQASDDQYARGDAWYPEAHELALEVGKGDVSKGAGIIAALSPRMFWERNVKLARDAGNGNVHGAMGRSLRAAQAILDGANPCDILPMDRKTGNFYINIVNPNGPTAVTVDVWAYRVATGDRNANGPKNVRDYHECVAAYCIVADEYGEVANVTQATTWNWARESWTA